MDLTFSSILSASLKSLRSKATCASSAAPLPRSFVIFRWTPPSMIVAHPKRMDCVSFDFMFVSDRLISTAVSWRAIDMMKLPNFCLEFLQVRTHTWVRFSSQNTAKYSWTNCETNPARDTRIAAGLPHAELPSFSSESHTMPTLITLPMGNRRWLLIMGKCEQLEEFTLVREVDGQTTRRRARILSALSLRGIKLGFKGGL